MDVNGGKGPNSEVDENGNLYDIRSFKIASFASGSCNGGVSYSDYCFVDIGFSYSPINCTEGVNAEYCNGPGTAQLVDYWGGINKACNKMGMKIASIDQINALASSEKQTNFTFGTFFTTSGQSGKVY